MGMTFHQTYECTECGYIFNGLRGIEDHGDKFYMHHRISPMICPKCNNMKNIVSGYDIQEDNSICENCNTQMKYMEKEEIYSCPQCHKRTLKCVNTDDVYSSGDTIYIY